MRSEKGQSLVETALILPILLLLLFGIVDFGRLLHAYLTIDHAGREAARFASVSVQSTDAEIRARVTSTATGLNIDPNAIIIDPPASGRTSGKDVTITIPYKFNFITPLVNKLKIVSPLTITDTTVMRVE
jgi:Flp pilus assembly protein TadG